MPILNVVKDLVEAIQACPGLRTVNPLNLEQLRPILDQAFPNLAPLGPLEILGSGFNSHAVVTAQRQVIRIGRTADAAHGYELERSVLPLMEPLFGSLAPTLLGYAPSGDLLPHGAICTSRLIGRHPKWGVDPPASLMIDLGTFMARLHSVSMTELSGATIPERDPLVQLLQIRPVVMPVLRDRLAESEYGAVDLWWDKLENDPLMRSWQPALSHRDLWHENILMDRDGPLTGVLDWSSLSVGDPAADFAPVRYFGDDAFSTAVESYSAGGGRWNESTAYRATRCYEGREFDGLAWAIENNDGEELEDSIRKLKSGPLLS